MPKTRTKTNLYDIDLVMRAIQDRFAVQVSDNQSLQRLINQIELAGYKTDAGPVHFLHEMGEQH